jgi:hypothetical protein
VVSFDITSISFTGTAGDSPAERAPARSDLVHPYNFCSRYTLAAGESPAVPVKTLAFILGEAFKLTHYPERPTEQGKRERGKE